MEKGVIRQFVAMPLGDGYTVEEQLAGVGEHGGVQLIVYPMKADRFEGIRRQRRFVASCDLDASMSPPRDSLDMGLAPGGRMKQEIYDDPYRLDTWDQRHSIRCFVTIANSRVWKTVTSENPPSTSPTAADYSKAGLPWFDYYDADAQVLAGSPALARAKSVLNLGIGKGATPLPENEPAKVQRLVHVKPPPRTQVREMPLS
jgi:hypothetical protein